MLRGSFSLSSGNTCFVALLEDARRTLATRTEKLIPNGTNL